jgi:hypothetical protein
MDRYERILSLHASSRPRAIRCRSRGSWTSSNARARLYRDIAFLRDALGAPLDSDGENAAFRYAAATRPSASGCLGCG